MAQISIVGVAQFCIVGNTFGEFPASDEWQCSQGNPSDSAGLGFEPQDTAIAGSNGTMA
ncbi:hypothetical protein [Candidatus Regiella endosymbiont of Tuberolachnus salignus]|uniref:hypothetical protein n=1 Tax=Candidatus Regiella endosymbiont of Tuberolachnus salignus TaxID=3077956 RepID=UPI0030CD272C